MNANLSSLVSIAIIWASPKALFKFRMPRPPDLERLLAPHSFLYLKSSSN